AWRGNVRIALKGANGSGKSTLLQALHGIPMEANRDRRGDLRRGDLSSLYIDQRLAWLRDDQSVLDNVRATSALSDTDLRNGLARFLFTRDTVFQNVGTLSGGERLRAALAQGFLSTVKPGL